MDEKVESEMRLIEEEINLHGDDFYQKMLKNMAEYAEALHEFYNQIVVMRVETIKAKLENAKCLKELEEVKRLLDENEKEDC